MNRLLLLSLVALVVVPAVAHAAASPGTYRGTSSALIPGEYGTGEPRTARGKVTFKVRSGKVLNLRIKGQYMSCADQPREIAVVVKTIRLTRAGKGSSTFTDRDGIRFKITIAVGAKGKASGKVRPLSFCDVDRPARFTAKRS